jgi:fatty-acyl-CoA synthase
MQPTLTDVFTAVARAVPDRPCLVHGAARRSYAEVLARTQRLGRFLAAQGLGVRRERAGLDDCESGQDHLALYLHNGPEYLEALLGALAARVAPFNVNYRYTAAELRHLFGDARPSAIVFHSAFAPLLAEVLPTLPGEVLLVQVSDGSGESLLPGAVDFEAALASVPADGPLPATSPDDLFLLYTGGTTGMPKGTMWRNGDLLHNLSGISYPPGASPKDAAAAVAAGQGPRYLGSAPFMHGSGCVGALRSVFHGGTVAIPDVPHRLDVVDVCRLIERERIDTASFVGEAFCRPIADELERGGYDVSSMRSALLSGGATQPATLARLGTLMPGARFADGLGSSETMQLIRTDIRPGAPREAGVFSPLPRARVVDESRTRTLKPGEEATGWLAATEPLPLGYLGDPAKTAETFPIVEGQRLCVPGDRVQLLADGRIALRGRDSMTINSGGEKIYAEEVERAVFSHPAVIDALVVGRPSERWGQEVTALIRLTADTPEPSDEELREHAGRFVARYKLPKAFLRVTEIRRNPMGKPDYVWARAYAAESVPAGPRP